MVCKSCGQTTTSTSTVSNENSASSVTTHQGTFSLTGQGDVTTTSSTGMCSTCFNLEVFGLLLIAGVVLLITIVWK